ncbi:flavodoxin [Desulfovibrio sp. OttesenSCG-928-C14]|nr:flavodoxin [Desulfovibrio sp. OttesenSCG-928-C14]
MAKALIVFGSTTGNTEFAAALAESALKEQGLEVTSLNAAKAKAQGLCEGYDLILFGASTWGDDSIEIQDDFIPLYDELEDAAVKGRKVGVFGCGDSGYTYFCGAVDAISEKVQLLGGNLLDTLKIDGDPHSEKAEITAWASKLAKAV